VLVYPFFELNSLLSKRYPSGVSFYAFFRLSKYEKPPSLPSLGLLNLHRRMLPLCVLSTTFAYLIHQPCDNLLLRLNTFGRQRIFPEYHFTRTSVLSLCLELVYLQYSFLRCNIIFLYSFSKRTKKSNIPQKEDGKSIFFIGSIMSHPWIKHICLFDHQTMGCSTTLGRFSRYIELCPPPFDYSSKHMESLHCLLLRRLMINIYVA
jgi:hypothetical protein